MRMPFSAFSAIRSQLFSNALEYSDKKSISRMIATTIVIELLGRGVSFEAKTP